MSRLNTHTIDEDGIPSRGSGTRPLGFDFTSRKSDHIREGVVKKEYNRASDSYSFSTRAATIPSRTRGIEAQAILQTVIPDPNAVTSADQFAVQPTPPTRKGPVPRKNPIGPGRGIKMKATMTKTSGDMPIIELAKKAEPDSEANRQRRRLNFVNSQNRLHSHFNRKQIKTEEVEQSTAPIRRPNLWGEESELSPRESNALRNYHRNQGKDNLDALVFKQTKGKAWKSAQNGLLVINSTISRDNTAGEVVRQAKLLADFGQKTRSNASIWRGSEDLREPGGTTLKGQQPPNATEDLYDPATQMMLENTIPSTEDIYDPDDVGLRNSPPLEPMKVNFRPSPTPPPAVPLPPVSPESSPEPPGRKGSNRSKYRPSQGDAVLVSFMDGGKHPNIARQAGDEPLASDNEENEDSPKGPTIEVKPAEDKPEEATVEKPSIDYAALAADALRQSDKSAPEPAQRVEIKNDAPKLEARATEGDPMEGVKQTIPSISTLYMDGSGPLPPDTSIKHDMKASTAGELPPIRQHSPQSGLSNGNNAPITLPSISDQLGDINHLPEPSVAADSAFPNSPPSRPPPRFSAVPGHGSPPKSPNDAFRRELPSPGRGHFFFNNANTHRRPSQTDGPQYASAGDYSSSNTETPSTDNSGATPATMAIDRMSIDGITNPQIGGFQCNYPGCTAQPFQTQYLLNSHANVHSSNRPHYCSVKGCPRSEGGKGFKRKNEMIRHGLVHDSPGYVCPFCPDREHKYPRPDNLQRHVRVHHVDKDKDDPQLREVLSQRPEGPSRGRRRRGGTS